MQRQSQDPAERRAIGSASSVTTEHAFDIAASDGVYGLSRVLNVFALLGVTPKDLRSCAEQDRLRIVVQFQAEPHRARLCQARLSALPCITSVADGQRLAGPVA